MDQNNQDHKATAAASVTAADTDQARENLNRFDRLDFIGWNDRDWDVFSQHHATDVHVGGFGQETDGIGDHQAWARDVIGQNPDSRIEAHPIRIGAGDWTAVTGLMNDGTTMATIARWENGQIAEEYLFTLSTRQ